EVTAQQIVPWLVGAMGLAGVLAGFICSLSLSRSGRRSPADQYDPARGITRVTVRPLEMVPVGPRLSKVTRDRPEPARLRASAGAREEIARASSEPGQTQLEFEARLHEILERRRRSAA